MRKTILVMRGNLRSRKKDGGHVTQSVIAEKTCCTQTWWLYGTGVVADRKFTSQEERL